MPRNSCVGSAAQNESVCDGWKAQHRCCQGVLWALVHLCACARVCASSCRTCWIVPSVLQPLQTLHQCLKYLLPGARNLVVQVGKDPCLLGRRKRSRAEISWRVLETYKEATRSNTEGSDDKSDNKDKLGPVSLCVEIIAFIGWRG